MIFLFLALNIFILKFDVKLLSLGIIQDFQVKGSIYGLGLQGLVFYFMAWFRVWVFKGLVFFYGLVWGLGFYFYVME